LSFSASIAASFSSGVSVFLTTTGAGVGAGAGVSATLTARIGKTETGVDECCFKKTIAPTTSVAVSKMAKNKFWSHGI